jgi:glycosyltransferase involved in cell wall biosynthesis
MMGTEAITMPERPNAGPWGVSVVVCCHNSAPRLPATLAHLAAQDASVDWEVVVVDNGSTDDTAAVARSSWPSTTPAPLRIVREARLGLIHARARGLAEARFEIVAFVDDDNWLSPDWLQLAASIMRAHPEVGACGGSNVPAFATEPPWWFRAHMTNFATGQQATGEGDVTETRGWLWGAGLAIRRSAWEQLQAGGFRTLTVGRQGGRLASGDDVELCFALRLAGWRLWHSPRLRLRHFIPASRLDWRYLRRLHRGFGAANIMLAPYRYQIAATRHGRDAWLKQQWQAKAVAVLLHLLRRGWRVISCALSSGEGDPGTLAVEREIGRLVALMGLRSTYAEHFRLVSDARWRRPLT